MHGVKGALEPFVEEAQMLCPGLNRDLSFKDNFNEDQIVSYNNLK